MYLPQRFSSPSSEDQLLLVRDRTLRQTRSGAGDAYTSGQDMPVFRTLLQDLYRCPQAQLRTFPLFMGDRGNGIWWIKKGNQQGRVQVTLDGSNATRTVMPALGEQLFHVALTAMTVLRQFGCPCGNFMQGAAGPCNRALQPVYKHPWGVQSHTFPILLLPRFV